jgi:dihydroorotase
MRPPVFCRKLPAADLLVRGAHVVDPLAGLDAVRDVLVRKGVVASVGESVGAPKGVRVIDAKGSLLLPGFVDLHTHTRVPGREDEEDIESVTRAAAAGGYVAIFAMANTDPAVDNAPVLESLQRKAQAAARVPVGFFAAVTRGLLGGELTDMWELTQAGAVGFSDDGRPLASAHILRRAMQYLKVTDRFIAVHAQDDSLMGAGVMHEGAVSARLGLAGIPAISESTDVARALEVAGYEGARLHLCHVSTVRSLEHLARARDAGVRVTAEATPHHLALTDEAVASLDSNFKMNPPLRPESDRKALIEALRSGVVDCIATDHAPHAQQEKEVPFEEAAFGTVGLETAFAVSYAAAVPGKQLTLAQLVERMSQAPARIAGIAEPTIQPKRAADFCLIDPKASWQVTAAGLHSKSANSAWLGATLKCRVELTVAAGRLVWEAGA